MLVHIEHSLVEAANYVIAKLVTSRCGAAQHKRPQVVGMLTGTLYAGFHFQIRSRLSWSGF